ncbi:MAG: hypothetical protein BGO55_00630 [Sphingobacteriales bacterium 50-39]|nr:hypothetical protein [Sphingobacteriales bacterium]OJW53620.1 MAG: hypothetical protein BGO55_00630 [Sphingobacteriales bacterium 50-39]
MSKILSYELIDTPSLGELNQFVQKRLNEGLQPIGNPSAYFIPDVMDKDGNIIRPGTTRYVQAIGKYQD